ncbi:hypothetical protein [Trichothermofontia sp.]
MSRKLPGFVFWLQWIMATLVGRFVGRVAAELLTWVAGHGTNILPLRMLVLGAAIGICQWWVLKPYLPRAHLWLVATTLGGGVTGMATILTGLSQWLVLRRWVPKAGLWIGITLVAGMGSWVLVQFLSAPFGLIAYPWQVPLARMVGDLLEGGLTASVMLSLLRQSRVNLGQQQTTPAGIPYQKLDLHTVLLPR